MELGFISTPNFESQSVCHAHGRGSEKLGLIKLCGSGQTRERHLFILFIVVTSSTVSLLVGFLAMIHSADRRFAQVDKKDDEKNANS